MIKKRLTLKRRASKRSFPLERPAVGCCSLSFLKSPLAERKSGMFAGDETEIPAPQMTAIRRAPDTASYRRPRSRSISLDGLPKAGIGMSAGISYLRALGSSCGWALEAATETGSGLRVAPSGVAVSRLRAYAALLTRGVDLLVVGLDDLAEESVDGVSEREAPGAGEGERDGVFCCSRLTGSGSGGRCT